MLDVSPIVIGGSAAVIASIAVFGWAWLGGRRADAVGVDAVDHRKLVLQEGPLDRVIRPVVDRIGRQARRLTPGGWIESLERRVQLAASTTWTVERALAAKLLLGVGLFLMGWIWVQPVTPTSLGLSVVLGTLGYFTPDVLLYGRAAERMDAIRLALPDTLDQLTISVEAGLGFDAALQRVANSGSGPLAEELHRTVNEITVGIPRAQAFRHLLDRTDVPELRAFVVALQQAEQYGLPTARVLRVQSAELRVKRRQRAEERAMKMPVKIVFPLVVCIFPALFIVLLGPALIRIIRTFS
jgi:tight adherence protein C